MDFDTLSLPYNRSRARSINDMSSDALIWKQHIITLDRGDPPMGLGFTVTIRQGDIYVKRIFRGGAADFDGELRADDKIIKIGELPISNMDLVTAVKLMRVAENPVILTVERRESLDELPPQYEEAVAHRSVSLTNLCYRRASAPTLDVSEVVNPESPPPSYEDAIEKLRHWREARQKKFWVYTAC